MNNFCLRWLFPLSAVILLCNCEKSAGQSTDSHNPEVTQSGHSESSLTDSESESALREGAESEIPSSSAEPALSTSRKEGIPSGAQALMEAYPDFIKGYENGKIIFTDGTTMIYDDGKKKEFAVMLDDSDLEDMFYTKYVEPSGNPAYLADAGRSRNEPLFKKMYGNTSSAVQSKLVNVSWFGETVKFTSVNGAAEQLKKVEAELRQHPELKKYLKSSGTFYWRAVRGAKRLSAHSYGIAFDIGVDHSDYWLWKNPGASETAKIKYANRIPLEIVKIFRKQGFIWGGAWYHFDTMHFEYRPEILRYAEIAE